MRPCRFCNNQFEEKDGQFHHIHPRFMNNSNGNGSKIFLCKKCHDIWGLMIPRLYWHILTPQQQKQAIDIVVEATKKKCDKHGSI